MAVQAGMWGFVFLFCVKLEYWAKGEHSLLTILISSLIRVVFWEPLKAVQLL